MTDFAWLSATELAGAIREKRVGSLELLDSYLERVGRLNPGINAVVARCDAAARERAAAADAAQSRGESWGPLHGVPITIKDSIEVVGMPATSGAPELAGHLPETDAPAAARLRDAGAVIFGKTNLPLYAGDMQSYNEVYGTTNNPWDTARIPGGSSGGSAAALAAGLCGLELGSDIGGSIRNPAHYCGVYGHKPSYQLVPIRGHIPGPPGTLSTSDLAVVGPLARSAGDLELALDLLCGPDRWDARAWRVELPPPRGATLRDFRVAVWLDDPRCPLDAEVESPLRAAVAALAAAGVSVREDARPAIDAGRSHTLYMELLYGVLGSGFPADLVASFERRAEKLAPDDASLGACLVRGTVQSHRHWLGRHEARSQLRAVWEDFFRDYDVLLCPIMPTAAFPHDHGEIQERTVSINGAPFPYLAQIFWAGLASLAYLPATVAPAGRTASGLPVGLQIIGPFLEDRTPLRFADLLGDVLGGFVPPPGFA